MLRSKLLSIGVGTVFAFIIVISGVWCVSTYFEYKQREEDASNTYTESNLGNGVNDNRHLTTRVLNNPVASGHTSATVTDFGRHDLTIYEECIMNNGYRYTISPPPYNQINCSINGESTNRYKY